MEKREYIKGAIYIEESFTMWGQEFAVHKSIENPELFTVSEVTTGRSVFIWPHNKTHKTVKKAKKQAKKAIKEASIRCFVNRIEEHNNEE